MFDQRERIADRMNQNSSANERGDLGATQPGGVELVSTDGSVLSLGELMKCSEIHAAMRDADWWARR